MDLNIVLLQLVYIIPSLAIYLFIVFYLLCSRDPEFITAFHTIFVLRAPADIVQVLVSLIAFRFPLVGWQAVVNWPWLVKTGFVLSQYACLLEFFAQLLLSINRLTAIAFPLTHRWLWTPRSTCGMFFVCAVIALVPTAVRLPQPAEYRVADDKVVPLLINREDQQLNSLVSCIIYSFFCAACLVLNVVSICILSRQRREKIFDIQKSVAMRVQSNLLIYSFCFTLAIVAMTVFQCILAIAKPTSPWYASVVLCLTVAADIVALSNPWLLLLLSAPFRRKFFETPRVQFLLGGPSSSSNS